MKTKEEKVIELRNKIELALRNNRDDLHRLIISGTINDIQNIIEQESAPLQARIDSFADLELKYQIQISEQIDRVNDLMTSNTSLLAQLKAADSVNEQKDVHITNLTSLAEQFKVMLEGQGKQNSLIYKQIEGTLKST